MPYGYRRSARSAEGPAAMEVFEPEAEVVCSIFRAYTEGGRSIRQICLELTERGIPSPRGNATWGTSMVGRLLRNETYAGTAHYNRREAIEGADPRRGARHPKTRHRQRPREEWIAIPVPALVDRETFEAVQRVSRENSQWSPRGAEPGAWLLRGLVECGHCGIRCNTQKMRGRNGFHRYYHCQKHDRLRAGGEERRCPERNIRANELDAFVFEQVRRALLDPAQLVAGERAVIAGAPQTDDELIAAQLAGLERKLAQAAHERARLVDAYQAELIELDELTRRSQALAARHADLAAERDALRERRAELSRQNRLRRGLAGFAERIAASLDELDFDARQRLLRLVIEKVRVSGWRVEIHLKIPLGEDPGGERVPRLPAPAPGPSSYMGLRSLGLLIRYVVPLHRALAFGLASFIASLAGILFVWWNGHIAPGSSDSYGILTLAIVPPVFSRQPLR